MPSDIRCTTCQKLFKTKPALKAHEKRLHGENILYFVCPGCNKTIRYIKNFAKHYMFAHKTSAKEAKAVEKTLVPNYANSINDIPEHQSVQDLIEELEHMDKTPLLTNKSPNHREKATQIMGTESTGRVSQSSIDQLRFFEANGTNYTLVLNPITAGNPNPDENREKAAQIGVTGNTGSVSPNRVDQLPFIIGQNGMRYTIVPNINSNEDANSQTLLTEESSSLQSVTNELGVQTMNKPDTGPAPFNEPEVNAVRKGGKRHKVLCQTILKNTNCILAKVKEQTSYIQTLHSEQTRLTDDDWHKSKVRQFNSIRKYLNPTMVALLRMEMFGSMDYKYRADEKQLSKDLFSLSPTVYEHMRNEWRFSLPPKEVMEDWNDPEDELM